MSQTDAKSARVQLVIFTGIPCACTCALLQAPVSLGPYSMNRHQVWRLFGVSGFGEAMRLNNHEDWLGQVIGIIIMAKSDLLVEGRLPGDDSGKIKHELDMLWDSLWDEALNGRGKLIDAMIESEKEHYL